MPAPLRTVPRRGCRFGGVLLTAAVWVLAPGCTPEAPPDASPLAPAAPAAPRPALPDLSAPGPVVAAGPLVVLVSWDTTRADALGAYADVSHWGLDLPTSVHPTPHTPTADALAARGVRFQWALAHAPTTLNSHTSIFSGQDPHGHRVPRNGYPVPEDVPLLAERFSGAGWDTIGVVGASVLATDMGLSRGFRVYDDAVGTQVRRRFEDPADRVMQRTLAAVDARPNAEAPLFLFVHNFDAHSPWDTAPADVRAQIMRDDYRGVVDGGDASMDVLIQGMRGGVLPAEDRAQGRAAYLAEVSFADQQLGVLLTALQQRGYQQDVLVVLVGDHGETLDEIPARPYQHGFDVDLVDIHVPFILAGTGRFDVPQAQVVPRLVSLRDVAPTVLGLAGVPGGIGDGVDLRDAWLPPGSVAPPPPPHFAEATKPSVREETNGWNNLPFARSVAHDGHFLRSALILGERASLHRLAAGQPAVPATESSAGTQAALRALLVAWDAAAPGFRAVQMSPQTKEGLRALGYLEEQKPAEP